MISRSTICDKLEFKEFEIHGWTGSVHVLDDKKPKFGHLLDDGKPEFGHLCDFLSRLVVPCNVPSFRCASRAESVNMGLVVHEVRHTSFSCS